MLLLQVNMFVISLIMACNFLVHGELRDNYIVRADNLPFEKGTDLQDVLNSCSEYRGSYQIDVVKPKQDYDPEKPAIDRLIIYVNEIGKLIFAPVLLAYVPKVKLVGNLVGKDYKEARSILKDLFPSEKIYATDGDKVVHSDGNDLGRSFYLKLDKDGKVIEKEQFLYPFRTPLNGTCYQLK